MAEPVLVLRALGLGDALAGVPALRGLRRLHPDRPLLLAAPTVIGSWFTDLGLVDGFVPTTGLDDAPPGRDLGPHDAVNLHGRGPQSHALLTAANPRSLLAFAPPGGDDLGAAPGEPVAARSTLGSADLPTWRADEHEVLRWCRLVSWAGGPCGPEDLRLAVRPCATSADGCPGTGAITPSSAHSSVHAPARTGPRRPYVVLHPGAASGSRRWPVDRWVEVAQVLSRHHDVRLTGGPDERDLCERIATSAGLAATSVTAGTLTLPGLVDLVAQAALLVCGDTGVAHVATATGTPSVLLFGPVAPRLWGPVIDRHRHACLWHGEGTGDPHADEPDPALLRITSTEVLVAAEALLAD
jgi:ADP-heptose:LPS heptosyltransferase